MIPLNGTPKRLCDGLTRRDLLQIGGLGAFGLGLWHSLGQRIEAAGASSGTLPGFGRAKACILLYKFGSPPQHETFDPKPDAPAEIQGELGAIATSVPGVRIGAGLPRIARIVDRLTIVRSLTHRYALHGTNYALSGIPEVDTTIEAQPRNPRQWPFVGSIVDWTHERREQLRLAGQKESAPPSIPRNIALPFPMGSKNEIPPLAGPYGAMLGMRYDPVFTDFRAEGTNLAPEITPGRAFHDPFLGIRPTDRLQLGDAANLERDMSRLELRRSLLTQLERARQSLDRDERRRTFNEQQRTAFSLLMSGRIFEALDYTREAASVREAYGMTLFGQSCLAARRLVEAGSKFVTVFFDAFGLNAGSWDTHHNHFPRLKQFLLPVFDQSFSALILDLEQRGMLDETLVLVISEHGRTPRIDSRPIGAGRDHWSRAYCQVYAGGGLARGRVVGRTDRFAGDVEETPISPKDVLATTLHLLGIDPNGVFPDPTGRPMPLTGHGVVRRELLA